MSIPVVIYHIGNQPYFQKAVRLNAQFNPVILIGDQTNAKTFVNDPNVVFVHVNTLITPEIVEFHSWFLNYSTNPFDAEFICFQRFFIYKQLMIQRQLDRIFHVDSDCIALINITDYAAAFPDMTCALSIQNLPDRPFHMSACIHNALLTQEFCDVFIQLTKDIYQNKSKAGIIQPKIDWHMQNKIPGGICDMTLCYLIWEKNMVAGLQDLNDTRLYENELCVFDHNVQSPYGFKGETTYRMYNDGLKAVQKKDGKFYAITAENEPIRLLTMHFQGSKGKSILPNFSV